MQTISVYQLRNGDVTVKYGTSFEEVPNAVRGLTTRVTEEVFHKIAFGPLTEAKKMARNILAHEQ